MTYPYGDSFTTLVDSPNGLAAWAPAAAVYPPPTIKDLTDDEQATVRQLAAKLTVQSTAIAQRWAYYDGLQRLTNIGISIPPQLAGVRTVVDWPRVCCDPLSMRAVLAGFRLPGETEINAELDQVWQVNDMPAEFPLAILDSLVAGRGYVIVGAPDRDGDDDDTGFPLITVESPLNLATHWDPRSKETTAAYQAYQVDGTQYTTLYLPDVTVQLSKPLNGQWQVDDRDEHRFGEVPVVRIPNRARSGDREGRSEITQAVMNTTDSACRSLLGMEIAREVYSIPHLWVLGASETDFQSADGTRKTAMDMAMTKFLAFERDEDGELPQVGQLRAFDPSVFTKIIDEHAQLMASYTGFPPSYFGQTTTANPASADAIRVATNQLDRQGERVQRQSSAGARKIAQLVWRFSHDGADLPVNMRQLEVDWMDASTPTPAATSDAVAKQIQVGAVPATSDVTLQRLGYTPLERARLAQDRTKAEQLEAEITSSLAGRQARAGNALATLLEKAVAGSADDGTGDTPAETPAGQTGR